MNTIFIKTLGQDRKEIKLSDINSKSLNADNSLMFRNYNKQFVTVFTSSLEKKFIVYIDEKKREFYTLTDLKTFIRIQVK